MTKWLQEESFWWMITITGTAVLGQFMIFSLKKIIQPEFVKLQKEYVTSINTDNDESN
jgi:hypothetical protein